MHFAEIGVLNADSTFFKESGPYVWLMDDHRWAYYIWESVLGRSGTHMPCSLVHLDYHWDGANDFLEPTDQATLKGITKLSEIYSLVAEDLRVRKDSFIAPAIIRGLVNEVHFLCFQPDTTPGMDRDITMQRPRRRTNISSSAWSIWISQPLKLDKIPHRGRMAVL